MKKQLKVQYIVGKSSKSLEYSILNNLDFLEKQFRLSIPLITGAHISYRRNKKKYCQKIYVGKEIFVKNVNFADDFYEKYNITLDDIADVAVLGYDRVCVLNFKKYDSIVVGVEEDAVVVPDYFALKNKIHQLKSTLIF